MANFTAAKIAGWLTGNKFTAAQATHLQACILKCPNFSDGSTHALNGPLVVNGSGSVSFNVPTNLSRDVVVGGDTVNQRLFTCMSQALFTGDARFYGAESHSYHVLANSDHSLTEYARHIIFPTVTAARTLSLQAGFRSSLTVGTVFTVWNRGLEQVSVVDAVEEVGLAVVAAGTNRSWISTDVAYQLLG